jgi:hypothetical protein
VTDTSKGPSLHKDSNVRLIGALFRNWPVNRRPVRIRADRHRGYRVAFQDYGLGWMTHPLEYGDPLLHLRIAMPINAPFVDLTNTGGFGMAAHARRPFELSEARLVGAVVGIMA